MPCRNLRFLVVEDHEFQRHMLAQMLATLGAAAVHTAADGRSALELLRKLDHGVDIVVSDLSMPGMDGMEFIRHLGESGARVSLIIASALELPLLASIANMAQAYRVRLLGAIAKPVTAATLTPLVELHRQRGDEPPAPEAAFSLDEIADAWAHGEFEPWFQPRVDLKSGAVRAVHATPRWRHGSRGVLAPPDFMPAIRARGLQDDFAWAMLQQCAVQGRAWHDAGRKLAVCAELGFDGLADVQLAARIRQTADDAGLESRHLVLGVPEAALAGAPARVLENLARLRMDGFGLAIEKFGKGRMDVERLATVAFTEVRIRSSFVANAHDDHGARAGLAVALDHARQLHLKAVAEGVASKEEWRLLHDWGCHYGAGPFIADPMPAEAVLPWLARWSGATIR